jgi:hypothetical protein
MRRLLGHALGQLLLVLLSGCGAEDLIRDPSVERWCGDRPCEWKTSGTVQRVGTWHKFDYAIELVSDDASVWQDNGTVTNSVARCFEFGMVAKVGRDTRVFLELDFQSDGSVELSQRLPASDWERLTFLVTTPDWYHGVRFSLRKEGPGVAILGELSAITAQGRCTAPAVQLLDRPDGARCTQDRECSQGNCENGVCGGCGDDADCLDAGEICGLLRSGKEEQHGCVPSGAASFGVACDRADQCESGFCEQRACSECRGSKCEDDRTCAPARRSDFNTPYWPLLCAPGSRSRAKGELCTSDTDCESSRCIEQEACTGSLCEPVLSVGMCS